MSKPTLVINGHNYTEYLAELTPTSNDLDADGSGRDVQTGEMVRKRITNKLTYEVKMLQLPSNIAKQLSGDVVKSTYTATILSPITDTHVSKKFYTSSVPFGVQRYIPTSKTTVYDGVSFQMIEV